MSRAGRRPESFVPELTTEFAPWPLSGTEQGNADAPPAQTVLDDPELRERAVCTAHGLPHPRDVEEGRLRGMYHRLGTFQPMGREITVYLPEEARCEHTYMVAATKSGKTEFLKAQIYSYVTQPRSAAIIAIDPAGDFVEQVAHWPEFVGNDRLVYINPNLASGMVPTINPLEVSGVAPEDTSDEAIATKQAIAQQLLEALSEVIAGGQGSNLTINMRALLRPCILALLDRRNSTLRDLERFMDENRNSDLVAFAASRRHDEHATDFFVNDFSNKARFEATKGAIRTKLHELFSIRTFLQMTCGPSTIDLRRAIEERKIILFHLGKGQIGPEASRAFGRLVIALIQSMAMRRGELPEHLRVPTHLFVDECHNFVTPSMETIMFEARKFHLYLTLCQQIVGTGMNIGMRDAITGSANIQMAGIARRLHRSSAGSLVGVEPDAVRSLNRGQFFIALGHHDAFKLTTRSDLVGRRHGMTTPAWDRLVKWQLRDNYRSTTEPTKSTAPQPASPEPSKPSAPYRSSQVPSKRTRKLI